MRKGMAILTMLVVLGLLFAFDGTAGAETLIMTVSPLQCNIGDTITVVYHGAPGNTSPTDDTVALYPSDADNLLQAIAVQHLNGSMDGTLTFTAPNQIGTYNIRMLASGVSTVAISPDICVHTLATVSATPSVTDPLGAIAVTYTGALGTASDWIGMFTANTQGGQMVASQSTNGTQSGVVTFQAPNQTGAYKFQLFTGGVSTALATSNDVQIENMVTGTPVQIVLQAYSPAMTVNGAVAVIDPASGAVPIIVDGRILVPIRAIVESMGGTVQWDNGSQTMTIQVENRTIQLTVGQTTALVDGADAPMDVAPQIFNGSILVPLRFVADNLGMDMQWDAASQTVTLTYKRGTFTQQS